MTEPDANESEQRLTLSKPSPEWSGARGQELRTGYARVTTGHQDLPSQVGWLEQAACDQIYFETFTGTTAREPEWEAALKSLRSGDTLVVSRLDRIRRSLKDPIADSDILDWKGLGLQVLAAAFWVTGRRAIISGREQHLTLCAHLGMPSTALPRSLPCQSPVFFVGETSTAPPAD